MITPIAKCAIEGLASTKRGSWVKSVALPSTITRPTLADVMKPSGFALTRAWITWATAPAIATDVASTTLSVLRYSARNTMVEKKSVASLANTSLIVVPSCGCQSSDHGQRIGGSRVFCSPVLRIPFGEIDGAVAGGECDHDSGPQRQAGHIDHHNVGDHHPQQGAGQRQGG